MTASSWTAKPVDYWRAAWRVPGVHVLESTTSTNDVAGRLADEGAAAGTTVITELQTAGRGRRGRTWTARPGSSILMSVVLRADAAGTDPSAVPIRVGHAVIRAIEDATGIVAFIKWPNDIVLPDLRKLGGILCEGASGESSWIVAGIGLNVTQQIFDFPDELRRTATSLRMAGGGTDREPVVRALIDRLRPFVVEPPPIEEDVLSEVERRDALRGRRVTVDGGIPGIAEGIAADGSLRLRSGQGTRLVRSGTVRIAEDAGQPLEAVDTRAENAR